jgi:hypothetical protein
VNFTLSDGPSGPYGAAPFSVPSAGLTVNPPPLLVSASNFTLLPNPVGPSQLVSDYGGGGGIGWAIDIIATGCPASTTNTPNGMGGLWTTQVVAPSCSTGPTAAVQITYTYAGTNYTIPVGTISGTPPSSAPTVTLLSPLTGPAAGGTTVTITGTGFTGATSVKFGANAGTSVIVVSDTQITVTSPAGAVGAVPVTVTTPSGTSTAGPTSQFTYI